MLPTERQKQIKKRIQTEKTLRISDLSERFNVSEMTIHRDIKPLIAEGLVTKTVGGISIAENNQETSKEQNVCVYCHKSNHFNKLVYRLIFDDGKLETACCAHCGLLRHRQLRTEASHAICHDFFMNTTMSASLSWYVMDTTLDVACCQPQVLTFANRENAEKFTKGFGGTVYGFESAMETVYKKMFDNSGNC